MAKAKAQPPAPTVDILELIKAGTHFAERRGDRTHVVDCKTGETFILYSNNTQGTPTNLELVTLADGTRCWIQGPLVESTKNVPAQVSFSPLVIDIMCQKITEGMGLTEICGFDGMPTYVTFCRWRREHPWIDEHIDKARKDRAEGFRDKIKLTAESAVSTKDPINAAAMKIDAYKYLAGVDNPAVYSPKAKLEATVNMPTQINIVTGIDRTQPAKEAGVVGEKDVTVEKI